MDPGPPPPSAEAAPAVNGAVGRSSCRRIPATCWTAWGSRPRRSACTTRRTPRAFEPCVRPEPGKHTCVFAFYKDWLRGRTLHLTWEAHGCGGAGPCLFGRHERAPEDLVTFLVEEEGLKRSRETMTRWVERRRMHHPAHPNILIGPLRPDQDALPAVGHVLRGPRPARRARDRGQLRRRARRPGAGDGAVRLGLQPTARPRRGTSPGPSSGPPTPRCAATCRADTLAFTVNRALFARLCALDERSFLHKPFWKGLQAARGRA